MGKTLKKFISCFTGYFDKILIDAPLFRRRNVPKGTWNDQKLGGERAGLLQCGSKGTGDSWSKIIKARWFHGLFHMHFQRKRMNRC